MNELQKMIDHFLVARGWKDHANPVNYAKSICIESAELLELFQWTSPSSEEIMHDKDMLTKVSNELADVMVYCLDLASILDLDPEKIIRTKMRHNAKKYPVALMKKDASAYQRRKAEYRSLTEVRPR